MSNADTTRVTIAIPAYNAQATLNETLLSVRRQSHIALEIIVVDDGSTDATAAIAARHAAADSRVAVLLQANGGVASARNAALARATGEFFAAIDADDVYHPDMIARQLQVLRGGPADVVLCYTWYAYIDAKGRVLSTAEPDEEGDVLARMCRGNLIGNGSSALMVTKILRDIGGWDPELRGGNEDYKTFFLMAERGHFAVVRDHLLGYRQATMSRSSKARQMLASYDQVLAELQPRYSHYMREFASGRADLIAYLFDKAVLNGRWVAAGYLMREAWLQTASGAASMLARAPLIAGRRLLPLRLRALLPGAGARKSEPFLQPRS